MFKGMPLFSTIFRLYGMLTKKMPAVIHTMPASKNNACLLTPNFTSGSISYF